MGKFYDSIPENLQKWIRKQHLFFVATAPLSADGHVNLSPKGMDCLRVFDEHTVAYLDMTGSGNETSAHVTENGRITMMWCSFETAPRILRAYGTGHVILPGTEKWDELIPHFTLTMGARQIIVNEVHKVQTSCGFAVPFFEYIGERETLMRDHEAQGVEGLQEYREKNNMVSLDGLPSAFATGD